MANIIRQSEEVTGGDRKVDMGMHYRHKHLFQQPKSKPLGQTSSKSLDKSLTRQSIIHLVNEFGKLAKKGI